MATGPSKDLPASDAPTGEMCTRDLQLARQLLAGDERAFTEFFDGNFPALFRFALTRLDGDEDAAEEVAQATLCKAISKIATFRGEAALFTWLCTFCRYEISAFCRRRGRTARQVELIEENPRVRAALESLGAGLDGPEHELVRSEISRLVQVVLDRLPSRYGSALEWKYIEEVPVREIAERLGLSPEAAESLLNRARDAFRDGFAELMRWEPSR